jgi:hypothetical protein
MHDRAGSENSPLGMIELMVWVAGLSALAGLVAEVVRKLNKESGLALVGSLLVLYVVHVAFSVRFLWKMPRVAVPTTMLIGATLWTFSLQFIERSDLMRALISMLFIPLATAYAVTLIFPVERESEGSGEGAARTSLVHSLLDKGKGLGSRSGR